MAKRNKSKAPFRSSANRSKINRHNTIGYVDDLKHICSLGIINESKRDWIETTMLRLRDCANRYEVDFAAYLMRKKIRFIHQAPFIFSGKIYFADFYLPNKHTIIELDGQYHTGIAQSEKDRFRDGCFNGNKVKVIRIPNTSVYNEADLKILCRGVL